jgi:hypothetical protein
MSRVDASKNESFETIASKAKLLRQRLRTIKRFRRQTLMGRAERLDNLLSEILLDFSKVSNSDANGIAPVSVTTTHLPIQETISLEEHQRLLTLLDHSRREYNSLIDFIDAERAHGKSFAELEIANSTIEDVEANSDVEAMYEVEIGDFEHVIPRPLSKDVATLHSQIEYLESELTKAAHASRAISDDENLLREQIEVLRTQLLESRHETIELRIQNSDLSEQADRSNSNMTWEQRKEALIKQLESDANVDPEIRAQSNQIAAIVESSQREIDERDRLLKDRDDEIEELQMLLTRQSTVTNGIAVGAAAVANILDTDELVQAEREKLRLLQREWEEKLRIAEIEISLERARISRERLEFESSIHAMPIKSDDVDGDQAQHCQRSEQEPLGKPRRWLRRLGLRDD